VITHHTNDNKFAWGVSHNAKGIIVKCEDDSDYVRILLNVEEAEKLVAELQEHIRQLNAGVWYGSPLRKEE
jgi:hypothetical protein